ncbi:hypothetical protein EPUL_005801, partial [Erysiphe pulchra]
MGPTASGKTALAVKLRQQLPVEIISVDSALIYRGMDIASGRIPLLVGGTMLYFKVLLNGFSPLPTTNHEIRTRIKLQAQNVGWAALHRQLQEIDIIAATSHTITEMKRISGEGLKYQVHQFAIVPFDRFLLHQRIEQRFHNMLNDGFENEVSMLFARSDLNQDHTIH